MEAELMTTSRFSFLTSGPVFQLALPPDYELIPSMSAALYNGVGGRSFDFVPVGRDAFLDDDQKRLISTLNDRDGRLVEVFELTEPPPTWWLRWSLKGGAMYTHLREEDGAEHAGLVVASLGIVDESADTTPFLLPEPPMKLTVSARPGYQESVEYHSTAGDQWIALRRPGYVAEGDVLVEPGLQPGDPVVLRAGLGLDVELQVRSGADLEAARGVVEAIMDSFIAL